MTDLLEGLLTAYLSDGHLRAWRSGRRARACGGTKATLVREDLLRVFDALCQDGSEGLTQNDAPDVLGVGSGAAGRAVQPLLDQGLWLVAKRPPVLCAPGGG